MYGSVKRLNQLGPGDPLQIQEMKTEQVRGGPLWSILLFLTHFQKSKTF